MCKFLSAIYHRDRGLLCNGLFDHHPNLLGLHGIPDDTAPAKAPFVRLELICPIAQKKGECLVLDDANYSKLVEVGTWEEAVNRNPDSKGKADPVPSWFTSSISRSAFKQMRDIATSCIIDRGIDQSVILGRVVILGPNFKFTGGGKLTFHYCKFPYIHINARAVLANMGKDKLNFNCCLRPPHRSFQSAV